MATITLTVTVSNPGSGNRYYIDGALQATVSAIPGNTYKFDQADNSNSGHPLRLSITSNGSHGGGSAYTTGVTTSGTPGSSSAYTQIEVTALTVQTLYYYCTAHSGMGGSFNVGSSSTLGLKEMSGFPIQNLTADSTSVGQIYYNSTSGSFKAIKDGGAPIGTWSSGGNLNTSRKMLAGLGVQTAAIMASGDTAPPPGGRYTVNVESYNGSAYTEVNNVNTGRRELPGIGTATAGLIAGGYSGTEIANTETWDGTNWSEANDLNEGRANGGALGTQTAGLYFGGDPADAATTANVESWNGTSWTEVNNLNTARRSNKGAGILTAGLSIAGTTGSLVANVESWDGTSWTEIADVNTARSQGGGSGTQTSALFFFGNSGSATAITEAWDGSSWTEVADGATARDDIGPASAGSSSLTLASGGGPSKSTATEEWTAPDIVIKTITTS